MNILQCDGYAESPLVISIKIGMENVSVYELSL
jgi:hypothetical protein